MPRLLFVTGTSPDVRGGSGTYVGISVLRRALEAQGCRVDFLAPRPRAGAVSIARRLAFNLFARSAVRRLALDAVVGFDLDGLFVAARGVPHIASIKGIIADEARFERGLTRLRLTTESLLERQHVRRSDRVLATSGYCAARLAEVYGVASDRIAVVPALIDLRRWRSALDSAERLPRRDRSILCVAHLYPRKDVATLLEAVARLSSDTLVRIVGIGPELTRLQALAARLRLEGRVQFLGHVSFERLAAEYRRADVFCLPSRQEGFGIVFLEAMAAGLPIVAARAAAVPEVVRHGESGVLVEPSDPDELARVLEGLLGDALERRRLGEAGGRDVEGYDAPLVARKFLAALGLLPSPSAPP